jgi:hypothetical protein
LHAPGRRDACARGRATASAAASSRDAGRGPLVWHSSRAQWAGVPLLRLAPPRPATQGCSPRTLSSRTPTCWRATASAAASPSRRAPECGLSRPSHAREWRRFCARWPTVRAARRAGVLLTLPRPPSPSARGASFHVHLMRVSGVILWPSRRAARRAVLGPASSAQPFGAGRRAFTSISRM